MTDRASLLGGLVVVEISSFVAAPLAGMALAQLGAEVIRVDPLGGGPDANRWPLSPDGASLYWAGLNKGKRSIRVDLKSDSGQRAVSQLLERGGRNGGILLTNAVGRRWLDFTELQKLREDLIHVRVKGRRDGGPAVDYTVNAASGFPLVTGPSNLVTPVNHVLPAWDISCGLYAAIGLLSALRRRAETGAGASIEVALEDVALSTAGHLGYLADAQVNRSVRPRIGNHLYGGFAGDFTTADGVTYMLVTLTPRHWADLVAAVEIDPTVKALESALRVDFGEEAARYEYRDVIAALIQGWFSSRWSPEVDTILSETQVLWSRFRSFSDLIEEFSLLGAPDLLVEVDQPGIGTYLAPASPIMVDGYRTEVRPAPLPGSDFELLAEGDTSESDS